MENLQKEIGWLLREKYFGQETAQFKRDVERLKKGEPVAYVIGFVDFLGCKIDLSKKPLIPRPETEFWVQKAIEEMSYDFNGRRNRKTRVLDMFSGSGCIGLSIVRHIKNVNITFAEKDKNLLSQIKINAARHCEDSAESVAISSSSVGLPRFARNDDGGKRYKVVQSDIFKNVKGKFDYIFANPPYIPTIKRNKIQKSVIKYEPPAALFAGKDGLLYIKKFLAEAKNFLNPDGKIFMEFDSFQKKEIEKLLKRYDYKKWEFHKDQYNRFRYVTVCN